MKSPVENGMVLGAEAAWDAKCEGDEYRAEWVRERVKQLLADYEPEAWAQAEREFEEADHSD